MMEQCQLWMGSLEPYMTENFIMTAFRAMGENPMGVKLIRNKITGEMSRYCFITFPDEEVATYAMHKLNGKLIPGTNSTIRFNLNVAFSSQSKGPIEREFSIWVGNLSSDVDDYNLYRVFSARYPSIKSAKIITDNSGYSRGYGFIQFGLEEEQKSAVYEMNGYIGLGSKPLKISSAFAGPKEKYVYQQRPLVTSAVPNSCGPCYQRCWECQPVYYNYGVYDPYNQINLDGYCQMCPPYHVQYMQYGSGFYKYDNHGKKI